MSVLKEVLVTSIQALNSRKENCRHAYVTEMGPKSLSGHKVVGLFKINESSVQLGRAAWLNGAVCCRCLRMNMGCRGVRLWLCVRLCESCYGYA